MQIPSDNQQRPVDNTPPKPLSAAPYAASSGATTRSTAPPGANASGPTLKDQISLGNSTVADVGRYVQMLKGMPAADTSKVDNLRSRIRDGSYTANTNDLADPLTDVLDSGSQGSTGRKTG
jgi:anti-sigma28 factor (negative regulator of flagellin synthesis)